MNRLMGKQFYRRLSDTQMFAQWIALQEERARGRRCASPGGGDHAQSTFDAHAKQFVQAKQRCARRGSTSLAWGQPRIRWHFATMHSGLNAMWWRALLGVNLRGDAGNLWLQFEGDKCI